MSLNHCEVSTREVQIWLTPDIHYVHEISVQTQQCPTNPLPLLAVFSRNKLLVLYTAKTDFWETEMNNSKKSRITFALLYLGMPSSWTETNITNSWLPIFMELAWGLNSSCLLLWRSSMLRHGSALKKYSSFHSCIYFFSHILCLSLPEYPVHCSMIWTADPFTHASLILSLASFHWVGWKVPRWSEVNNTALGSARHAWEL